MAETLYNEKGGVGDTWAFFRSTQGASVEIEAFGKHCVREYRYEKKFYCSSGYAIPGEYQRDPDLLPSNFVSLQFLGAKIGSDL